MISYESKKRDKEKKQLGRQAQRIRSKERKYKCEKKMVTKLLPLNKLRDKSQAEFNKWIRNRDQDKGCVSCHSAKVENASHFYNAGQYTALRFNESNVAGSCITCNKYRHGNLLSFRMTLLKRIGEQKLNLLESIATRNRVKRWSRSELELIYKIYKEKNKEYE